MRSKAPVSIAAIKSLRVSTRRAVNSSPASDRVAATRSASTGSSSRRSRRSGVFTDPLGQASLAPGVARAADLAPLWRRLVEHSPEYAEFFHRRDELLKLHRLDHVGIGAERVALGQV